MDSFERVLDLLAKNLNLFCLTGLFILMFILANSVPNMYEVEQTLRNSFLKVLKYQLVIVHEKDRDTFQIGRP